MREVGAKGPTDVGTDACRPPAMQQGTMKLFAISDLHLGYAINRQALQDLPEHGDDWLILAGDVGETAAHLNFALRILTQRFARVIWTPGNHDLWTMPETGSGLRGEQKYRLLVEVCRHYGVLTPEDPYIEWPNHGFEAVLAPVFTLYDYSFRPADVPAQQALAWAEQSGVISTDEELLHPDPYPTRAAWCAARCRIHGSAPDRDCARQAAHSDQSLPAARGSSRLAPHPALFDLVRHAPHRNMAQRAFRSTWPSTATCIYATACIATACAMKRSRWAIPGSGIRISALPATCARSS